jgi:ectoine hydroxylase-related dioxygenase (phytanoyl-CoA dioxygenase family)
MDPASASPASPPSPSSFRRTAPSAASPPIVSVPPPGPVRALLFNKTPERNWALGWHQDRTIPVRKRIETPGFAHWTIKSGIQHVEPPFALLERMLTLRVHLDPVGPANAPLLVAAGSQRLGKIPEQDITPIVQRLGTHACLAERGDIWLYATTILHASEAAEEPKSRRVLQVDYSADTLPPPLEWLGV